MKNTILTLTALAALAVSANAQTFASWASDSTATLNGINISATVSGGGAINSFDNPYAGGYGGDSGTSLSIIGQQTGNFSNFTDSGESLTFNFSSALSEDILFHFSRNDSDWTFSSGTFVSSTGGTNPSSGTWNHGDVFHNNGGGTIKIEGGTSLFQINILDPETPGGGDTWVGTFSTVPEPSSTALLGLGTLGLLARRKR